MTDALHLAAALELLAPSPAGLSWTAVCVWCLERADPGQRHPARRLGGDCMRCAYSGPETFAAMLPLPGGA